ncbi:unnamed protein product [Chrysodeixis includens]|uniref:Uncharacterized protein n=1 Tax=Chrysodeixis includens TaxID=689277 RepID=A0A9P0BNH5_CHRIL|nr:unnamed protein product [Chrysodeixis includens]
MPPKKGKDKKEKEKVKVDLKMAGPPPKPKKIPPPPAIFTNDDLVRYKELYKLFDEDNIDKVPITAIPTMLRKLGFNPKTAEIEQLFTMFLEDDLVDMVEYHEWLQMIEAKMRWGDDFEQAITDAMKALGHDDEETGFVPFELFRDELMKWGEPLSEIEFMDWLKLAVKDRTYSQEDGMFCYGKFVENMNNKDERFFKEPVNYFKLDQKTLAAMAIAKAQEEKEEQERKAAEKAAREEAKRQRLIAEGLLQPD